MPSPDLMWHRPSLEDVLAIMGTSPQTHPTSLSGRLTELVHNAVTSRTEATRGEVGQFLVNGMNAIRHDFRDGFELVALVQKLVGDRLQEATRIHEQRIERMQGWEGMVHRLRKSMEHLMNYQREGPPPPIVDESVNYHLESIYKTISGFRLVSEESRELTFSSFP